MRQTITINKEWRFRKTDALPQEYPADWDMVSLPHTWNEADGQDGGNDYYRGMCTYAKSIRKPDLEPGKRAVLEFNGAAMTAVVYWNGQRLAVHEGGYSTFRVDVTDVLQEENLLCVTVDNSSNDRVYPQKADFTFYGGLYRDVKLILVSQQHFELIKDGAPGIKVTPQVKEGKAVVLVETWQNDGDFVRFSITDGDETVVSRAEAAVENGYARVEMTIQQVHLWDGLRDPYLYRAEAELVAAGEARDAVCAGFGCRTFSFDKEQGFILNGRSYPLRGVSRHQDRSGVGNALTCEMHREDMELIREIGANTIRLAHYQQAQEFYDLADRLGMLVWAEIPYITQHMPDGRENTLSQLRELVVQNYNHPSVVCWGLSNEITAASPVDEDLLDNHRLLNDLCHKLDSTRPTVLASAFMLENDSPVLEIADINSYNLYFGWYLGDLEQNEEFLDAFHSKFPDRSIGLSEYGADANPDYHSSAPEQGDYTEEYQCLYHEHILRVIEGRPWLWATHVWNMFDFAADGRDEGGAHGINQKGLVTMDRRIKKDAFYLYKAYWSKEPFLHLCGRRYTDRTQELTEVKVYSNLPEVALYLDGALLEKQTGGRIYTFQVPLKAEHTIECTGGGCSDRMKLRRVSAPNPAYGMKQRQQVVNWFLKEETDPSCYSIMDTMGELALNPQAAAIVEQMIARASASRGDVAKSVQDNQALKRMMAKMTVQSLLKQAKDAVPEEAVRQLNAALQRIRKTDQLPGADHSEGAGETQASGTPL